MSTPQLALPQNPKQKKTATKGGWGIFVVVLLQAAILAVLCFPQDYKKIGESDSPNAALRKVAFKLEESDLRVPAIKTWIQYLQQSTITAKDQAAIHMRIAKLFHNEEKYEQAIRHYFLAKELETDQEIQRKIVQHISDSLQSLKRFQAMNAILGEFVEHDHQKQEKEVVAQIDSRDISADDLEKIIDNTVNTKILTMKLAFPQMVNQQPGMMTQMRKRYETPQGKKEALEEYLLSEILWRKALEDELERSPNHRRQVKSIQKTMLSQEILQREIARQIVILPEEVKAVYDHGGSQFMVSSSAQVAIKTFVTEEEAKKAQLTKEQFPQEKVSIEKSTSNLADYGDVQSIASDIFTSQKTGVYDSIYKTDKGFAKIWVEKITPESKQEMSAVESMIKQQIYQRKYQQIMQQFIRDLYGKYKVQVYMPDPEKPQVPQEK